MRKPRENEQLNINLSVAGVPLPVAVSVPTQRVSLRRMLPVIQKMSSELIALGTKNLRESGKEVSCGAGCGACCRQLVPVAEAEAYALSDLVEKMGEPRRSEIKARFNSAIEKLNSASFFKRLDEAAESENEEDYDGMITEYFRFQIACPFLANESCSIHASRPIACREYLVTSSPEFCSTAEGDGVENVRHFFQVKEALISLARRKTAERLPFVPLICSMEFARTNRGDSPKRTGREWMQRFFTKLAEYSKPVD